ncbi:MAG: T9SS type A sorting domain-containing protein, partial [bacterium]|nr:T9SS type A sorting domain-containing protein [bacterium]
YAETHTFDILKSSALPGNINEASVQCFPNPFNSKVNIKFTLNNNSAVSFKIYNLLGQEVNTLVNKYLEKGVYNLKWDASKIAKGIYYYQYRVNGNTTTGKLVSIK